MGRPVGWVRGAGMQRHCHLPCSMLQLPICAPHTHPLPAAGDGTNDNFSWNCGVEGRTDNAAVNALRQRQMRNMHLALMVSQGTPMLLIGEWGGQASGRLLAVVCLAAARPCAACAILTICPLPCAAHSLLPSNPPCHPPPALLFFASCLAGDEYGQTRDGNNNYYGHDTVMTHYRWDKLEEAKENGWFRCACQSRFVCLCWRTCV